MRAVTGIAVILGLGLAAASRSVAAQTGPTLAPVRTFDVASVRAITNAARSPMLWQPPGHFTSGVPIISLISIGFQVPLSRIETLPERLSNAPAPGERPTCGAVGGGSSFTGGAAPLAAFVGMLAGALQRPIVDKSGLTGRFDIDFKAAPLNGPASGPLAELPSIFTAVEDQLGLKLQAGRGPVEVLVIDRVDMPTEN